jgi:cell division protein FtsI (penicillin-binding protein 3)
MNTLQPNIRLTLVFFLFVAFYAFLVVNLYRVQILRSDFFRARAQKQYEMTVRITPPRAEIFDRTGQPLALNNEAITAFIIPSKLEQKEALLKFLSRHFKEAAERLLRTKHSHFMYIKRRLSQAEVALIEMSDIPDIKLLRQPSRYYPIAGLGPIIGFTNIDNQGVSGLEMMYNDLLAGSPSTYLLEKESRAKRFYFTRETLVEGTKGQPITLTIDRILQFLIYEELKDYVHLIGSKNGSVLICDPENGDIIVMANYPDFDPNNTERIIQEHTKNRIITDAYEYGSVIKGFIALAALEEGVVSPDTLIDCEGRLSTRVNGSPITTTKANGIIPFEDVIKYSNNIGVAKVAQKVGTKLYEHYTRLGFSKKFGIFPGESPGFISPPHRWSNASLNSLSFGYEIRCNLAQMAQALCIIAHDGYKVKLHLLKDVVQEKEGPLYSLEAVNKMKRILRKTVSEGALARASINNYNIMGKTGTARLITNGRYDHTRHLFTFMGIIEADSYKRVIVVSVKETAKKGLLASQIVVPLFEKIAHKMLIHDKIIQN